ncbi:hypothetical protein BpHYR1_012683, partial [Brachionus plicatilis]
LKLDFNFFSNLVLNDNNSCLERLLCERISLTCFLEYRIHPIRLKRCSAAKNTKFKELGNPQATQNGTKSFFLA